MALTSQEQPVYVQFRSFATQFAESIARIHIDRGQWVGRLYRVYHAFELNTLNTGKVSFGGEPAIADPVLKDQEAAKRTEDFRKFLETEGITKIAISDVKYEFDPVETTPPSGPYFFATGFIDILESTGGNLKKGTRYSFRHRIKATYHATSSVLQEMGPSPVPLEPAGFDLLSVI